MKMKTNENQPRCGDDDVLKKNENQSRCGDDDVCTSASLCPDMAGLSKSARLEQLRWEKSTQVGKINLGGKLEGF